MDLSTVIVELMSKYPVAASVLAVIGVLRVINKPIFAIAHAIVEATPSKSDDDALAAVEASAFYKGLVFVLDWFASVKVGQK